MTELTTTAGQGKPEGVESFRARARIWLAGNMPRLPDPSGGGEGEILESNDDVWPRARELQRILHAGGFAGICFPREYSGLGLTREHQRAFNEECVGYEMPMVLNTPTFSICGATVLDMGSEEQKQRHLPAIIRGDEIMAQFLSEPRGGSDLAGVTTRATRDGDVFVVNGSKIWSSAAYAADWALCLARTDWDAPKHRGMTMFLVKVHRPGIDIKRIKQVNGNTEFCQEFFDDVEIPVSDVLGEINGGWAVTSRLLFHERNAVGGGSPYVSGPSHGAKRSAAALALADLARRTGQSGDSHVRELIAESHTLSMVHQHLINRIVAGMTSDQLPPAAGAVIRLFDGDSASRQAEIGLEVAGSHAATADSGAGDGLPYGESFLMRQAGSLGGGSTEMARNIISEQMLGMPREYAADRDVPFNQVRQGKS